MFSVSQPTCNGQREAELTGNEGVISSHVTDETGCGSARSPWVIAATPGQTIELSIIDFGSELYKREINATSPGRLYGYIQDGEERFEIVGGTERERDLHRSITDILVIEITISPDNMADTGGFLLKYQSKNRP